MSIQIRPLEFDDRDLWEEYFDAYAKFYKTQVTSDAKSKVWNWIHDSANDFWCDLALNRQKIPIGFVQYQLMHRSLGGGMVCYLSDLYVVPDARGTGAGRAMIDHVIEFAKNNQIPNVRWLTQEYNYAARKLYDHYQPKSDFILYSVSV